jgi:uncharacterized protein (DUF305 family)
MTHTLRKLALPLAALAASLALASCGTSASAVQNTNGMGGSSTATATATAASGAPAAGDKNEADTLFATMMIPHHAQAIEMADLALSQATDPKVKALAPKIKGAQGPEITRMSGWLTGWGAPVPSTAGGSGMSSMSGMGEQTGGMMSAQEMSDLGAATGAAFDRMWLKMMITHHEGAVAMAKDELAQGANPEAKQLAQAIIDSQSTEIAEMRSTS